MSEALKDLLFTIRQHPAYLELLGKIAAPEMPRYRPSKGCDLETLGASMAYASGARDQHECWLALLKGASQKE